MEGSKEGFTESTAFTSCIAAWRVVECVGPVLMIRMLSCEKGKAQRQCHCKSAFLPQTWWLQFRTVFKFVIFAIVCADARASVSRGELSSISTSTSIFKTWKDDLPIFCFSFFDVCSTFATTIEREFLVNQKYPQLQRSSTARQLHDQEMDKTLCCGYFDITRATPLQRSIFVRRST